MSKLLYTSNEWNRGTIETIWNKIDEVGKEVFQLDYYDPQIEIISSSQMIDNYASIGLPFMYEHWSFGKEIIQTTKDYASGNRNLAYEMVINTNPTITYLMENNTTTMQALVLAHACCGHGSFFKNNYLFKEWTDPDFIIPYVKYARDYIKECEDLYGTARVEKLLDACHSLRDYGVDKYKRPAPLTKRQEEQRFTKWSTYLDTLKGSHENVQNKHTQEEVTKVRDIIKQLSEDARTFPEENVLYFIEKYSPSLEVWQREIVRIVRKLAQYFYPQSQTKLMNEGWASFVHYNVLSYLESKGYLSPGQYLEVLHNHSNVLYQPQYQSLNPYALGFHMFKDLQRVCEDPDEEDLKWFPDIANTNWKETLWKIMINYRDESFIMQYLSPKIIRKFNLFNLDNKEENEYYEITEVSDDEDIYLIRDKLSQSFNRAIYLPHIEVVDVNWKGDRTLVLYHKVRDGRKLDKKESIQTLDYLYELWGFSVELIDVDEHGNRL